MHDVPKEVPVVHDRGCEAVRPVRLIIATHSLTSITDGRELVS